VTRTPISTADAPQAIGTYSQAVRAGGTVRRVFDNLRAVAIASGGDLSHVVKVNVFLTDLAHFALVNRVMAEYFQQPYPARAAVGVASLPRGAAVEMDAILAL
jgi:reactive intermediate/imine deaminase